MTDHRAQLAEVVECIQESGWHAELDPNGLAYSAEVRADQDADEFEADVAACQERAGLAPQYPVTDMSTLTPEDFAG